jgi:hypothetical protein
LPIAAAASRMGPSSRAIISDSETLLAFTLTLMAATTMPVCARTGTAIARRPGSSSSSIST